MLAHRYALSNVRRNMMVGRLFGALCTSPRDPPHTAYRTIASQLHRMQCVRASAVARAYKNAHSLAYTPQIVIPVHIAA